MGFPVIPGLRSAPLHATSAQRKSPFNVVRLRHRRTHRRWQAQLPHVRPTHGKCSPSLPVWLPNGHWVPLPNPYGIGTTRIDFQGIATARTLPPSTVRNPPTAQSTYAAEHQRSWTVGRRVASLQPESPQGNSTTRNWPIPRPFESSKSRILRANPPPAASLSNQHTLRTARGAEIYLTGMAQRRKALAFLVDNCSFCEEQRDRFCKSCNDVKPEAVIPAWRAFGVRR